MRLTLDKTSALRVLRAARSAGILGNCNRTDLEACDPTPRRRWTASALPLDKLVLDAAPTAEKPLHLLSPAHASRPQAAIFSCTSLTSSLPEGSFIDVGAGISIPCPELLYVRLSQVMPTLAHVLLGYELCGTYCRDAANPKDGAVVYEVPALTTPEKIRSYIQSARYLHGFQRALDNLEYVEENAWSPMESVVSTFAMLPVSNYGYEVGRVVLNPRHSNDPDIARLGGRESRVPDILIAGTGVGFNYDGRDHYDLKGVADAAASGNEAEAIRSARFRYVDDLRRNRELASMGYTVLPVTSEDLYEEGGLDAVMLETMGTLERLEGADYSRRRQELMVPHFKRMRQKLIWSCLPGRRGEELLRQVAQEERMLGIPEATIESTMEF